MSHRMPYRRPIRVPLLLVRDETEYEAVAHCHYTPARPAPHCSDHDDPRFSDPGDSEELDVLDLRGDGCELPADMELTDEERAECMRWCAEYLDAMREAAADEAADRRRDDY